MTTPRHATPRHPSLTLLALCIRIRIPSRTPRAQEQDHADAAALPVLQSRVLRHAARRQEAGRPARQETVLDQRGSGGKVSGNGGASEQCRRARRYVLHTHTTPATPLADLDSPRHCLPPCGTISNTLRPTLCRTRVSHSSHSCSLFRVAPLVRQQTRRGIAKHSAALGLEELWSEAVTGADARGFFTW
jgi:hypothetical protein